MEQLVGGQSGALSDQDHGAVWCPGGRRALLTGTKKQGREREKVERKREGSQIALQGVFWPFYSFSLSSKP